MGQSLSCKASVSNIDIEKGESKTIISYQCEEEEELTNPNADPPLVEQVSKIIKQNVQQEIQYMNFPFFTDQDSITYIYSSKILFLMKGLAGSGKSTVAKQLKAIYKNSVVFSADDYFNQNNRYVFDKAKLPNAHIDCKQRAVFAAQCQCPVIVIDNTNICFWEMKFYVDLAKRFNYVVIAVEPCTPWKFDAQQLSIRNSHEVPFSIISDKIKMYQEIKPIYYGWFLNDIDSIFLLNIGKSWLDRCWKLVEFFSHFKEIFEVNTSEDLFSCFSHGTAPLDEDRLLHCTSRFTSRWEQGDRHYHGNVQRSIGKVYLLRIIGFVITANTFAARIALTDDQLTIWGGEEAGVPLPVALRSNTPQAADTPQNVSATYSPPLKRRKRHFLGSTESKMDVVLPENNIQRKDISTRATLRVVSRNTCPPVTSASGSRAHITLGVSKGVSAVMAGVDLEEVVRLEQLQIINESVFPINNYEIPGARITNFQNGSWAVYLHKIIVCETIFSHLL